MSQSDADSPVPYDAEAVLESVREAASALYLVAIDHLDMFELLYVDEAALDRLYGEGTDRDAHFEQLHRFLSLEATEMDLLGEAMPTDTRVRYTATGFSNATIVRVYPANDDRPFCLVVGAEDSIDPLLSAVESTLA